VKESKSVREFLRSNVVGNEMKVYMLNGQYWVKEDWTSEPLVGPFNSLRAVGERYPELGEEVEKKIKELRS